MNAPVDWPPSGYWQNPVTAGGVTTYFGLVATPAPAGGPATTTFTITAIQ